MSIKKKRSSKTLLPILLILALVYQVTSIGESSTVSINDYTSFYGEVVSVSNDVIVYPYGIKQMTAQSVAQGDTNASAIIMSNLDPDVFTQNPHTALVDGNYVYRVQIEMNPGGYNWVDNAVSDIDSSPDVGTHSAFSNQQIGPDSIFDTLTEGAGTPVQQTFLAFATGESFEFKQCDVSGEINGVPNQVYNTCAKTDDVYTTGYNTSDLNGLTITQVYANVSYYGTVSGDLNWYYNSTSAGLTFTVMTPDPMQEGGTSGSPITETYNLTSIRGSWSLNDINNTEIQFKNNDGGSGENAWVDAMYLTIVAEKNNYELDLEVQWTSADFDESTEKLAIYVGSTSAENLQVDVWSSGIWNTVINSLVSEWNNVSVSTYLDNNNFIIRFKGTSESGDSSQDSWQIDSAILVTGSPPADPTPPNTIYRIDLKYGEILVDTLYVKSSSSPALGDQATAWFNIGVTPPETETAYKIEVTLDT